MAIYDIWNTQYIQSISHPLSQLNININISISIAEMKKTNSLEQKQVYLRSQIIDSGVDPQSFMIFMGAAKGQGENINLENWTLPQLKKIVSEFKQSLEQQLKRQQIQMSKLTSNQAALNYRASRDVADRVMGSKLPKKEKVFYDRDDLWDYQLRTKQQCKKTHSFFDFKNYPEVNFKGIEVKKTGGFIFGIGAKSFIQIVIASNFSSKQVARKSQDVDWLRTVLTTQFPGSYIPPLQPTPIQQIENKNVIAKRARQVINFLNSLVHFDHLVNNKYTHMFLTESDPKAFQNFKAKTVTLPATNSIQSVQNLQGFFPLEISQRVQDFVKNSSKYSKQNSTLYKAIEQTLNKVQNDYNSLIRNYHLLAKDLGKLQQKYLTLSQKCRFNESEFNTDFDKRMIVMMRHLKEVFATLQLHAKKSAYIVKDVAQQNVKYIIKQWSEFDIMQSKYKRQLESYLALRSSLSRRKQQFFLDLSKKQLEQRQKTGVSKQTSLAQKQQMYKIKYSAQSKLQDEKRQWQGYINYMYQKSFMMLLNEQEKQLERKISKVFEPLTKMVNERCEKYKSFQKYLDQESKKLDFGIHEGEGKK